MADSQDKLTPADQKTLADLEKQLAEDKATPKANKNAASNSAANKSPASNAKSNSSNKDIGSSANTSSRPTPSKASPSAKTGILWFFTLINLLLLVGVVGAGYWGWMQWQTQSAQQNQLLTTQNTRVQNQQSQVAQSLSTARDIENQLTQQNQALQASVESLVRQLQITSEQVSTNQQNLADVTGRRPSDWLLAEADYLVRMAGRKLWLENDVRTSGMMLESADSRLADLNDPSLIPIREKLASDIQKLQLVNQVSIDSVALSVGALLNQIDSLPLAYFKKPETESSTTATEQEDNWRTNLARNWQQVTQDFFSVKRKTTEIKPFMSDKEQWLAKEQLKFALLQAQVAVLKENSELFQQSLNTSVQLTNQFFDLGQNLVTQFLASLTELQATDIERIYPEQFSSAPALQDLIERRLDNRFVTSIAEKIDATDVSEAAVPAEATKPSVATESGEAIQP
ncbi:uroporphyrinogen-III C-methyltransferase [Paraglaciecola aquimarina]|uniref:Uroporphyrinogen-III C-methyltransferase n=1 Tax=Paraglaciecola algarum TaxID=3050085 RepID=A0ABS9D8P4_9ALTE|nr:uroporphyrinogen-III C-methyltransferase [Paraglaciecola sp. G1-23]MCF2949165.1 uroporphyrinogen-III C-methyltransferase [Paraglaciecola sp. G1-23]